MANKVVYGFMDLKAMFARRVTEAGTSVVSGALRRSAEYHSQQMEALIAGMVERTTDYQIRFNSGGGGGTLQPLDEFGSPLPTQPPDGYTVAFPIQMGGDAKGTNRVTRALMTVEEANNMALDAQRKDARWMIDHMLAAILDSVSWTYKDPDHGDLTIRPLANTDGTLYEFSGGADDAEDNHYLGQAAAISDAANPFPAIAAELSEHPVNRKPYVSYVATSLVDSISGLTAFVGVNRAGVELGNDSDRITAQVDAGWGDEVIGYVKGADIWVVEARTLPAGYMVTHARGSLEPVLKMREYDAPELKGLQTEIDEQDGNLKLVKYIRMAGFGGYNRVGAHATYIGNAAYQNPAAFNAPMP